MAEANIKAVITAKDEASSVLRGFGDNVSTLGSKIGAIAKVAAEGIAVAAAAAVGFGVVSVKAYEDSQNQLAQLNAVLKSTANAAGVTSDAAINLSKSLQKTTKFSDEEVLSAENLLLTFTKIGKDIFPQATETVLNMATALGEDTKSASIQLGKALQDPILGITALRRVGVNFSDDQKKVIENLVNTGHAAEAQKIILKELETEFGGSAVAAGSTFAGSLAKLKNSFNDIQEVVGRVIVEAITPFIQKMAEFVTKVDWEKVVGNTIIVLRLLFDTITGGDPTLKAGEQRFAGLAKTLSEVQDKFITVKNEVVRLYQTIEGYLEPKIKALWNTINNGLVPALLNLWRQAIQPVVAVLGKVAGTGLVWAFGLVIDTINSAIHVFDFLAQHLQETIPIIVMVGVAFAGLAIKMAIDGLINSIIIGFNTLTLVTIPSLLASFQALGAFLLTPWGAIVAGVLLGIGALTMAFLNHRDVTERLKQATNDLKTAKDGLKQSTNDLKHAQLDETAASLNAEAAQKTYNDAVARYGVDSLEAKQALNNMQQAQLGVEDAHNRTIAALKKQQDKEHEVARDTQLVDHLNTIKDSLDNVASHAVTAGSKIDLLGGKQVTVKTSTNPAGQTIIDFTNTFKAPGKVLGGYVSAGVPVPVGERGPETFIPSQNGVVVPHNKSGSGGGNISITINAGAFMGSDIDARKFAKTILINLKDLAGSKGLTVSQLIGG